MLICPNCINFLGHIIEASWIGMEDEKVRGIKDGKVPTSLVPRISQLLLTIRSRILKMGRPHDRATEEGSQMELDTWVSISLWGLEEGHDRRDTWVSISLWGLMPLVFPRGHPSIRWTTHRYESRKLNEAERRYAASKKEMLVVVHCLWIWRQYLLGAKFIIKTYNNSICYFFDQLKLSSM